MAKKRLEAELCRLHRIPQEEFTSVGPVDHSNIFEWRACLRGPKDTPYEGGRFQMQLKFPTDYPFKPPKTKFTTKIFHPNISNDGDICVDILQGEWSPAMQASSLLISISSLLAKPNPMDPLSMEPAALLNSNPQKYKEVAMEWTRTFAH